MFDYEYARWYVAGFIDGEGSVTRSLRRPNSIIPLIRITAASTDFELIEKANNCYDALGIESYVSNSHKPSEGRKRGWSICVHKATSIIRASEVIPLQHIAKREKLFAYAQELREKSSFGVLMGHGTNACYARGCRCDDCRLAKSEYRAIRKEHRLNVD